VLDGMRGIAAFAVINDHVASAALRALTPGRYLAVDFFWVLSGLVLAHAYEQRLKSGMKASSFMMIRLVRLYPLYLLGTAIGVAFAALSYLNGWAKAPLGEVAGSMALAFAFAPAPPAWGWAGGVLYPYDGPAWTLLFELIVNALYAAFVRVLTWRVFAVLLPVAGLAVLATVLSQPLDGPGWMWVQFDAGLSRVIYCFFAGVLIQRVRSSVRLPALPAWAAALALIAVLCAPAPQAWRHLYDAAAAIFLMPALVALSAGSLVRGRLAKVCAWLGAVSYGVYVLHVPMLQFIDYGLAKLHLAPPGYVHVLLVAACAGALASLATPLYDVPSRRWLMRRLAGERRLATA
jgi:peptidoglycan/LPS O-acetylase OafA/YrhL